ncbi:transporter (CPA2 family) [Gillisia mitskevichiae]|uniref:Transporter (CPA2 family) n=1 Tax=Gillisia mitskevichiae TaxID=270921 RepID=A0A495PZ08_9FLAO|nr:cation:proton antiporter [Gillisia mitskevichiae]RKS55779.1 transporter (CPA2 family) [Gillisia mitskevichiae]
MVFLSIIETSLPLTNPVLKFLIILIIILIAPILLGKLKIPHILGLIIAGAIIGPNGFNLLLRDSGIILSGTAGLLYIMFLAGLEIDMAEFKRNSSKSLIFGMYTFLIPMILGMLVSIYILDFPLVTSVLLASMFASHTLIAYPILSKFGVTKNRAVNIAVGGTMITDILALLVLAVIVGMHSGEVNLQFWIKLSVSILIFGVIVLYLFPIIGRWFLKRYQDKVSQYIFVLAMVFFGSFLAEVAGVEAIIGAFLTGLALNKLIPATSPLMNRIDFVGNAIFIPFFLIGVGMLVNYKAFISDFETIKVAAVMTITATSCKFIAAWLTQKTLKFSVNERRLIFGLSNAQAAATLAAVLIGYNIIIGETTDGEPIRLLGESILNGTIIMILITCTIATFVAQKGAQNISFSGSQFLEREEDETEERILIPISNPDTVEELINFSTLIKSKNNINGLYALNIVINNTSTAEEKLKAKKILEKAVELAASTDIFLQRLLRYDLNIINGITGVIKENNITDLVLGFHSNKSISENFLGKLTNGLLANSGATIFVYRSEQPIATIKRYIIIMPAFTENEIGFPLWLLKVWNISRNTGAKLLFYAPDRTLKILQEIQKQHQIEAEFKSYNNWGNFSEISEQVNVNDNILLVLSRENYPSYNRQMQNVSDYINNYFPSNSFILIYPKQLDVSEDILMGLNNPSLLPPIEKLDKVVTTIFNYFKQRS